MMTFILASSSTDGVHSEEYIHANTQEAAVEKANKVCELRIAAGFKGRFTMFCTPIPAQVKTLKFFAIVK